MATPSEQPTFKEMRDLLFFEEESHAAVLPAVLVVAVWHQLIGSSDAFGP